VQCQPDLLQVVLALGPVSGFTGLLNSGQEQTDEDREDGNHHQDFNQC
jgi:hypothetical protein